MEIRGFTFKYSKIKAKQRKNEEFVLQDKTNDLLQKSEKNPSDKHVLSELYVTNLYDKRQKVQFSEAKPGGMSNVNERIFLIWKNKIIPKNSN